MKIKVWKPAVAWLRKHIRVDADVEIANGQLVATITLEIAGAEILSESLTWNLPRKADASPAKLGRANARRKRLNTANKADAKAAKKGAA